MRHNPLKNSFTGGLLSKRLAARTDLEQVADGCRQSLNGLFLPHGGHAKRTGTYYVATAKNRDADTALIPFEASDAQQYIMELGKTGTGTGYIRFFANGGVVETSPGSGIPYEVVTPFDDPQGVRVTQSADKMWMVHPNVPPQRLVRTDFRTFTLTAIDWTATGGQMPMRPPNVDNANTASLSGTTLSFAKDTLVVANDVGRFFKVEVSGTEYILKITAVTNTKTATVTYVSGSGWAGTATTLWSLGLFSNTEGCGALTLHQGRLWFGGAPTWPDWIVGSVSDDFENFDRGTSTGSTPTNGHDDRSIAVRIVSRKLNTVRWIGSFGQVLGVGCTGGEFRIFGSNNDILTPTTTSLKAAPQDGSANVQFLSVGIEAVFVQRSMRALYKLQYDVLRDQITSQNITIFAEDIFDPAANGLFGCKRMDYQQIPDSVIWAVHGDGSLVSFTYDPDQRVSAAGKHVIGDTIGGKILDVAVIQNVAQSANTPWFVGDFTVNGSTVRYIFYLADQFRPAGINRQSTSAELLAALNTAYFVDLGIEGTFGTPVSTVSGLGHLEGCTVSVLIDGKIHPDVVVSGGAITTNFSGLHFVIGLPINYYGETSIFAGGAQLGTDQGQPGRIAKVNFTLQNSLGGQVGVGNGLVNTLEKIPYPTSGQLLGEGIPMFNGSLEIEVESNFDDERTVYWENKQPLPMTVLAIAPRMEVNEG